MHTEKCAEMVGASFTPLKAVRNSVLVFPFSAQAQVQYKMYLLIPCVTNYSREQSVFT